MLWRPKRGGGAEVAYAVDEDVDALGDMNDAIDPAIRGTLIDTLMFSRDNMDENDATFRNTTNIR
jgi:hypothetical protein